MKLSTGPGSSALPSGSLLPAAGASQALPSSGPAAAEDIDMDVDAVMAVATAVVDSGAGGADPDARAAELEAVYAKMCMFGSKQSFLTHPFSSVQFSCSSLRCRVC